MSIGTKLSLSRAKDVAEELITLLRSSCERLEIAGSIRRLRPAIGDIELVAIPKISRVQPDGQLFGAAELEDRNELWATLDRFIPKYIRAGDRYRQFTWSVDRHMEDDDESSIKVDVFSATPQTWGLIYLIRTGSVAFSTHVVTRLAMNKTPSHAGAVRDARQVPPSSINGSVYAWSDAVKAAMTVIPTPTEEDVFRLAGMRPLPPAERSWI